MAQLPKEAKNPQGFTECGVDADGDTVFFGFKMKGAKRSMFVLDHEGLAAMIEYLQAVAHEAEQRRLEANPAARDVVH
jgi:hypothetical protein